MTGPAHARTNGEAGPGKTGPTDGAPHLIETLARLGLPGETGEAVIYHRTSAPEPPPDLIAKRDIAEAGVQALMAAVAATRPVRAWPAFCRRLARSVRPQNEADRVRSYTEALRAIHGEVTDAEARSLFDSWWEGLYRRRMMVVREFIRPNPVRFTWTGRQHLDTALASGNGAVIWAGEFMFQTLAGKRGLHEAGFPIHQVSSSQHGFRHSKFGNATLNRLQLRTENKYLDSRLSFDGQDTRMLVRKILRLLKSGAFVIFTNNVFAGRSFIQVPLGPTGFVSFSTTPIGLALRHGVPLFCVTVIEREPFAHYEVRVSSDLRAGQESLEDSPSDRSDHQALLPIALLARDELLGGLREAPDQFLNLNPLVRSVASVTA